MKRKWLENPGGGISRIEDVAPEDQSGTEADADTVKASTEGSAGETTAKKKKTSIKQIKKSTSKNVLAENGQTLLDVSRGNVRVTENGATGGGLSEDETELNPKGYWITGTTTTFNIEVSEKVKTEITLDSVDITVGKKDTTTSNFDCINVSGSDVIITLKGVNRLLCNSGRSTDSAFDKTGAALAKDGMDGSLTIQCEHADEAGHKCTKACGSLYAGGAKDMYHIGAIGSTLRNAKSETKSGFSNLTIRGGNIEAEAGLHAAGIGSACLSEMYGGGYTKNIKITGGIIKAIGTELGAGIGSGGANKVEHITITGGFVEAYGGEYAPGIGASGKGKYAPYWTGQSMIVDGITISGGDTIVKAVGDQKTSMPGIGSGGGDEYVSNVTASPYFGFQGYIQDGTSETNYTFVDGTPFKEETAIEVGKYYTMVYFGPFRDTNEIEKDTKDQIGANHVISKTGGEGFTKDQLKGLTKVTGKDETGTDFDPSDLTFTKEEQIQAINQAKTAGKTGEFPLTFKTPNGTETTVTVYLKADGTDAAQMNPEKLEPTIGADGFCHDTGGEALSEEDVKKLASVQGKDSEGTTYPQGDFTADAEQLETINEAKTSGKGGTFELTFTSRDGKKATVEVVLKVYDETTVNETSGEQIKGLNIISKTGGEGFTKEQLKELSDVTALDSGGDSIDRADLVFPNEDQIKAINEAKTVGKTGDFPLTIEIPDGTGITIHVFLRDSGTDQTKTGEDGEAKSSLGANHITQSTGGEAFSEAEITELCEAKGKNKYGNNVTVDVDKEQLRKINKAKAEGKTGEFKLTFFLEDGTKAEVTVTLTGDHKVTFNPDGGDYQPKDQIVVGGRPAVEPKEPKKEGYVFEGWYYTDETGKEVKWDFDTPVHQSMTLRAKWKKEPEVSESEHPKGKTKMKKKDQTEDWNYKEVTKRTAVEKTGDKNHILWIAICIAGAAGAITCVFRRKRKMK
ncbi:InlB B-repeat-containing protein [Anaerostipes caccae]|uniref:InlB B-repeat-containing protein n=1 Tax=Anaerostipes caccae TaxID=105841 RepID=UPI0038D3D8E0